MKGRIILILPVVFSGLIFCSDLSAKGLPKGDFARERSKMAVYLVTSRGVTDNRVLKAMKKVRRDKFVSEEFQDRAYKDMSLSTGYGQTISPTHTVALMTQALGLKGNEKVLEIGTGSGYQAAVLAEIVKEVYTIEIIDALAKEAEARLHNLGYSNIKVKSGDGFIGWKEYAPYDAIIVAAAVDKAPEPLIEQLAEGGRLVIPLNTENGQKYTLIRKIGGKITEEKDIIKCEGPHFVPMTGKHTGVCVPDKK